MRPNAPVDPGVSRRRVLAGSAGLVVAGLAGCATNPAGTPAGSTTDAAGTDTRSVAAGTATDDERADATITGNPHAVESTAATPTDGLDLREANVVGVAFESRDGSYRFDVTLHHDDDGEEGYANWWQVETLDGRRLGRRELLHAHGTREFTRSDTVDVPDGTTCVVVRGHDQVHGYGGQAALVTLDSGATATVGQGSDPRAFDASDCP